MGSPDDRYVSNQDTGRRLYVGDGAYADQMGMGKRPTAFQQNTELYKQSELKKPYLTDSYEDMEYLSDPPIGLGPYPPGPTPDNPAGPIQEPTNPWHVRFLCFSDPCYGYGEEHCEPISCNWVIQGYEIRSSPAGCKYKLGLSEICGECPEGETFQILFDVLLRAQFEHGGATITVDGRYYGMSMSHCIGQCDGSGIAWDSVNSSATIGTNTTVPIAITDSNGTQGTPYSWSVAGTGFTLANAVTDGLTNTLISTWPNCGIATITVTGCDGTAITGLVKCTFGTYKNDQTYPASSPLPAACDAGPGQCWCSSGGPVVNFDIFHRVDTNQLCGGTIGGVGDCAYGISLGVSYTYVTDGFEVTQLQIFNSVFSNNPLCNHVGCWAAATLQIWGCA